MSTPYYQDETVTLYCGSALELHDWLTADVLITDPPYGSQQLSPKNGNRGGYGRRDLRAPDSAISGRRFIAGDDTTATRDAALALWGPERPALVFGTPRMPDPPGEWNDRLVWDKRRLGTNGGPWRYRHESIYVRGTFIRTDDAASSIIEAAVDRYEQAKHIHAKPLALMLRLVAAAPLGVIADPFAGSGSTLAAAKQLGRQIIGVELDEAHCENAVQRLAQGALL